MTQHLLEVRDLAVEFRSRDGVTRVLGGVSYHLDAGETLAVLGESGSGKSVAAQAVMGILDSPPGYVTGGQVLYQGRDLLRANAAERRQVRGREIAMIFQDALSALNPVFSVGYQIAEPLRVRYGPACPAPTPTGGPSSCSTWSGSPVPGNGSASTRTSSPAACGSA